MNILVIDDVALNRAVLENMLADAGHHVVTAGDGAQALAVLERDHLQFDVVLLDLIMPGVDGFAVLAEMGARGWLKSTPVIVISGERDRKTEMRSLDMGATDFIIKPFDRHIVIRRVTTVAELFAYKRSLEQQVVRQTETLHDQYRQLRAQAARIEENNHRIIDVLGTVVEFRNLESGEHIKRVKEFTRILAQEMMERYPDSGLTPERVALITAASPLHDIGKITISDAVLLKPGRLTPEEFEQMKAHTTSGDEILESISDAWNEEYRDVSRQICRSHHERWDGRGYPDGLKGDEIPLSAQLVSVADVYDALVSPRVYKDPFPLDVAFNMVVTGQCGTFAPRLLECFRSVRAKFEAQAMQ